MNLYSALAKVLAALVLLAPGLGTAIADTSSFEDAFTKDDSAHYDMQGGQWSFDSGRRCFAMAKALTTNNEAMWALRRDVTLPRAFTLEADYTADGNDTSAALALKNPDTGNYALATLSLKKDDAGGWWVTVWFVYSYPDENWGYLQQSKKHVANLVDPIFRLQLTRSPRSNALEFLVANSDLGTLETSLSPETRGEEGKKLSPAWIETLDALSFVGVYGYDSGGSWSHIKLTDLSK
jgi:hypothetical protein